MKLNFLSIATVLDSLGFLYAFLNLSTLLGAALLLSCALALSPYRRSGKITAFSALTLFAVLKFSPLEKWLLTPLENRFPPCKRMLSKIDGIIVLGGALNAPLSLKRERIVFSAAGERVLAFYALAEKYSDLPLVYTGGFSVNARIFISEAAVLERLYAGRLRKGPVIFEKKSQTTEENARLTYDKILPAPDSAWLLVTSAWHMPRSVAHFRAAGWRVVPYPVDYRGEKRFGGTGLTEFPLIDLALKEWLGMASAYLLGKTKTFFPAPDGTMCEATSS